MAMKYGDPPSSDIAVHRGFDYFPNQNNELAYLPAVFLF